MRKNIITELLVEEEWQFDLKELAERAHVQSAFIIDMIDYGLLEPKGHSVESWYFTIKDLDKLQKALRLQKDLDINLPGISLAIDLMDELDQLREKLNRLEKETIYSEVK